MLRAGYATLAAAFAAFAGGIYVGALLVVGLMLALVGGVLLAFSQDELPKWAGRAMIAYFLLIVVLFLASTPVTINKGGGYFINGAPPAFAKTILDYLGFVTPVMLGAIALTSIWEREWAPRALVIASLAGCALFALLNFILVPDATRPDATVEQQGAIFTALFVLSGACGAAGCAWAAARPEDVP